MGSSTSRPDPSTYIPSPSVLPNLRYPATSPASSILPPPPSSIPKILPPAPRPDQAARTRRQAGLFFGGAAFVVFSSIITRRSLTKRGKPIAAAVTNATKPGASGGVGPSAAGVNTAGAGAGAAAEADAAAALNNSGPILAIEALTVASMNVFSWAIMATGGALWYFDIASMEDLRRSIRGGMGVDGTGRTEEEAEQEMEEWLATVLSRKDDKRMREEETRLERQKKDREEFAEFQRFKNERGQAR